MHTTIHLLLETSCSATSKSLWGMLLGRFFVGTGLGLGPPVAALYVAEVCIVDHIINIVFSSSVNHRHQC